MRERRSSAFFLYIIILACVMLGMFGCAQTDGPLAETISAETGNDRGGLQDQVVIDLPLSATTLTMCVQGVDGEYSHRTGSTKFDLDFDTSNTERQEVFAPISGVAHVHDTDPGNNFGIHVNIDLGDGTYITIAHLDEAFVASGSEVASGQLLGFEGCTGFCQGDHIHIGRHRGNARMPAENGTSVPVSYRMKDVTAGSEVESLSAEEVVCGLKNAGDAQDGHTYASALKTLMRHPDGTLVKTPDAPNVYLVENGTLRWIRDEPVFSSYHYRFSDVALMSKEAQKCYGMGSTIDKETRIDAVIDAETGTPWLVVGRPGAASAYRQRVQPDYWPDVLRSWGLAYSRQQPPSKEDFSNPNLASLPVREGVVAFRDGALVSEQGQPDVYAISNGTAMPIVDWDMYLLLGFYDRDILTVDPGAVSAVHARVGNCEAGEHCLDRTVLTQCGTSISGAFTDPNQTSSEEEARDPNDTPDDPEPVDISDVLDLDEGELGFVFVPVDGLGDVIDGLALYGSVEHVDGVTNRFDDRPLADGSADVPLAWSTDQVEAGDRFHFRIEEYDILNTFMTCKQVTNEGSVQAALGRHALDVGLTVTNDGCRLDVEIPLDETETDDGGDTSSDDTDQSDTDSQNGDLHTLEVSWTTPFAEPATRITLSGEYILDNGTYGFFWKDVDEVYDTAQISRTFSNANSGDSFRFSVEFEDDAGEVSWSCIHSLDPVESMTPQGTVQVTVDGQQVAPFIVGDPRPDTMGCGFKVIVP